MRSKLIAFAVVGLFAALAGTTMAQDYPSRPVTIVVPFAAGGPADTIAWLIAEAMSPALGQQVVIENVSGTGGVIGAARVATAAPDGYTLLLHHIGLATSATLYRRLPYRTLEDFEPIGLINDVPMTIVARKDFPPSNVRELISYIIYHREQVTLANAGVGSASHLCGMLLMSAIAAPLTTVPYRGTGPAMNDLAGGYVDLMCDQTTNTIEQIIKGAIKVYAVTTQAHIALLPNVPTTREAGLPALEISVWYGLYTPRGTPEPIINRLAAALQTALRDGTVRARLTELGSEPASQERATPAALREHLKAEVNRWAPIIRAAGVYAD